MGDEALLLVAHGSRSRAGVDDSAALAAAVAEALPGVDVALGFLEMTDPPAGAVLDELVRRGGRRVVVLPLMLFAAGHAKSDVPAVVVEGRLRHPEVEIAYGRPLGAEHALVALAAGRIRASGGAGLPLAVLARGTSDPDANAEACRVTRLVAEHTGAPLAVTGFSGVASPSVPEALDQLRRLGAGTVVAFAWYVATGVLLDRIREDFAAAAVDVVDAGYLGPCPELAAVVVERYREAIDGDVRMSCDTCSYRRPYPGLEERVGQPVGVGHSHLAAEHRGHGHPHGDRHDHDHDHDGATVAGSAP